jgi:hypothetical protein
MIRTLPTINIADEMYYIDLRLREFRHVDDLMNSISFDQLFEADGRNLFLYDSQSKNVFSGDDEEYERRKEEIELVNLPDFAEMDPEGFALMQEREDDLGIRIAELLKQDESINSKGKKI